MNFNIKLNDYGFRYDIYQMFNIFYSGHNIEFVEENKPDYNIEILKDKIVINEKEIKLDKELPLKEAVKKSIFIFLWELTKDEMPWGTLVGIRPSKIALSLLEEGMCKKEIVKYFNKHYCAREDKAGLCIEIAEKEKGLINLEKNLISVYIGMPFCPTRCLYCSFTSNPIEGCKNLVEPYLQALTKEIREMGEYIIRKKLNIESVYFGGGTPTAVDNGQFEEIMQEIYRSFIKGKNIKEFTVECGRPDSMSREKLHTMKKYKVHRISINPQTMNEDTLRLVGRRHSLSEVEESFNMARTEGFNNINMDLIVGLPNEDIDSIKNTCEAIKRLKPDSITVHGMSIKRGSRLYENLINNYELKAIAQSELDKMFKETVNLAKSLNLEPYYMYRQKNMVGNMENIGYATKGKENIYNIQMIEEKQSIIACGADAISKAVFLEENRIERAANVKDVREYIKRVDEMIERKKTLFDTLYN